MSLLTWLGAANRPTTTTTLLYGDLRTGRIYDTIDATALNWAQVLNDAGAIDSVQVPAAEVRAKQLRHTAPAAKTFLAVDVDGELQEAGPLWHRGWDDETQTLTLGAAGLWSLYDHRKVLPAPAFYTGRVQDVNMSSGLAELGSIGRQLVAQALYHVGGDLPLVLPAVVAGSHTETWFGWQLLWIGDQLRQLTKRENGPDIRFRPRYTTDRLGIQWVYEAGTEAAPLLTQAGEDWYFDRTVPRTPVVNIVTDEDGTQMGQRGWVTGEGSEAGTLIGTAYDPAQVDDGFPLLEVDEARSSVSEQATLDGHAADLVSRSARPIERWKVVVRAEAARGVWAGHFARVINRAGHAWLPDGESFMRIERKTGDLGGNVTLEMYEVGAV